MKAQTALILTSLALAACSGGGGNGVVGTADDPGFAIENRPPEILGEPAEILRAGEPFYFQPDVRDADGDPLEFRVANLPDWAYFDEASGAITGYPDKTQTGKYQAIRIVVSDGSASSELEFSLEVLKPLLNRNDFVSEGSVVETVDGFRSIGTLVMTVDGEQQRFEDADLELSFDEEGVLVGMSGETSLPPRVSDNLALDASVRARVGYFSGAELNADPDIDILLKDEQYYFVYYTGQDLDLTISADGGEKQMTLGTPLGGAILFVTDPTDVFYYYYGAIPLVGAAGEGLSLQGLVPFQPWLDYEQLDSFDGHIVERKNIGLGIKIFDVFEIDGWRITRMPEFHEILLDDDFFDHPFDSPWAYKTGINGEGNFAFGVLGFELFSFDFTELSATLDVGFDRQHLAMRSRTAPDVSWVPESFPFVPVSETIGDWFVDGSGDYEVVLRSSFETKQPAAVVEGQMMFENGVVTMTGQIDDGERPLGIDATFFPGGVDVAVDFHVDFADDIVDDVTTELDRRIDSVQQAYQDLQQATGDYRHELSLRGTRQAIPDMVDRILPVLDAIPGTVRNEVDAAVVSFAYNHRVCKTVVVRVCSYPLRKNRKSLGDQKGEEARQQAAAAVATYRRLFVDLKNVANLADDEQFRAAIKAALQAVYDHRTFSKKISVSYYSKTHRYPLLSGANLTLVQTALANVDRIEESSAIMISAQQLYDALPVEETLNTVRDEVEQGITPLPSFDGAGYVLDNGVYSAYAVLDGEVVDVDLNVLNPAELAAGIARLVADRLAE